MQYGEVKKKRGAGLARLLQDDRQFMHDAVASYGQRRREMEQIADPARRAIVKRGLDVEGQQLREQAGIVERFLKRENDARKRLGLSPI